MKVLPVLEEQLDRRIETEYNFVMDLRVYKKEEVLQPSGSDYYYVPNVIDIYPHIEISEEDGHEILTGADILTDDKDIIEQECALATIWQRGNDLVNPEIGVRWAEVLMEEINVIQLMEDLREAVADVTLNVIVIFDTVTDTDGNSVLQYTLQAVA